jgi:adenylyltransferase/sulfurtransferase
MNRRMNERYSCTGLVRRIPDRAVPTTALGASVAAALQVNDAVRYLHDPATGLPAGHRLSISLQTHRLVVDELPINPHCESHGPAVQPMVQLGQSPAALSARDLAAAVMGDTPDDAAVELGFDVVESFECLTCGTRAVVGRPAGLVYEDEAFCPRCGAERRVVGVSQVGPCSALWDVPLGRLGVADREWLRLMGPDPAVSGWVALGGDDPWESAVGG